MKPMIEWCGTLRNAGLVLSVLVLAGCASSTPAPVRQATVAPPSQGGVSLPTVGQSREHVVQPGDTLMGLGRLYGRSVNELIAWNNLSNPNQIVPGQRLLVAPPGAMAIEPVAVARPVEVIPVLPPGAVTTDVIPLRQEPKGGTQPYSDQTLASIRPEADPGMPPAAVNLPDAPPPVAGQTGWLWPASGALLAGFSEATNKGIDIAGRPGDPVVASADGKVVYSGSGLRGYGKLVIIKHDESYLTAYAHNQALLVKEGDTVSRGQKIAELGSTDADRPKLHFEIRKQGRPVDPMGYLPPR